MRGTDYQNDKLFSYVRPDSRVPADHPLRTIRRVTDTALTALSPKFAALYSAIGRPSAITAIGCSPATLPLSFSTLY